jgi:steroid delta-isomerase-like uncharacterized protein
MGTGKDLWNDYETLLNKHDSTGVASLYVGDGVYIDPHGRYEGPEAIRAYLAACDRAFPDSRFEASLLAEEKNIVVAEWTIAATFLDTMVLPDGTEIPPTGQTMQHPAVSVCEIRDGKFIRVRDYFDPMTASTQLGLTPGT